MRRTKLFILGISILLLSSCAGVYNLNNVNLAQCYNPQNKTNSVETSVWHLNDSIRFTNQIIEQEIRLHEDHLFFINVYNHMIDESGLPVGTFFLSEGLHINDSGYALWKTIILEQFESKEKYKNFALRNIIPGKAVTSIGIWNCWFLALQGNL